MTDDKTRDADKLTSLTRLKEVVKLGVAQGLFTTTVTDETPGFWRWVNVETPDGCAFIFTAGGWGHEGSITCKVDASRMLRGLRADVRDSLAYQETLVEASASSSRSAAALLKDFTKRVMNEAGKAQAQKILLTLRNRVQQRENLRGHIATLEALGYDFRDLRSHVATLEALGHDFVSAGDRAAALETLGYEFVSAGDHVAALETLGYDLRDLENPVYYSADGWGKGDPRKITVNTHGIVSFDLSCDVARFAAVLAALEGDAGELAAELRTPE